MSDDTAPQTIIEYTEDREVKGLYILPRWSLTEINDVDWKRLRRFIESIPKRKPIYREAAVGGLALAAESFLVALIEGGTGYWVAAFLALVVGAFCFHFDRQTDEDISASTEAVLQDMDEVYARSRHREETVSPK